MKQRNTKIGRLFNLRKQISKDLNRSIFNLKEIYSTKTGAFVGKAVEIKMQTNIRFLSRGWKWKRDESKSST